MDINHTPGPWTVPHFANKDLPCDCLFVLADGYLGSICTISVDNGILGLENGENNSPPLNEAIFNAKLISTSPDLLKSLIAMVEAYRGQITNRGTYGQEIDDALIAIRKATEN